jgi:predicted  nucleic acid-binding Zn-ribbon protein
MAVPTVATIKKVLEGIIVPEMQIVKDRLAPIEGETRSIHSEIKRLDDKIDNLDKRLSPQITLIDEKLTFTNKRLDEALDIRERLAALKAKVGR